jgi:NAD(P)-dependent dehydrogenase (short-subunit alcohol dehydrogenase family)
MAKEIEAERKGAKCLAISADVRDIKSMERAVEETINEFGRIDFVIAGAAGNFLSTIDVPSPIPLNCLFRPSSPYSLETPFPQSPLSLSPRIP